MNGAAEEVPSESVEEEASSRSPLREEPDDPEDEIVCSACTNFRDNAIKAFEQAAVTAKLQAQNRDLDAKLKLLRQTSLSASANIEDTYRKLREVENERDSKKSDLEALLEENVKLKDQNVSYLEVAKLSDNHRRAADDWRSKHVQTELVLFESQKQYEKLLEKYKNTVDLAKETVATSKVHAKKALSLQETLEQKNNENKAMKKHWTTVVRLIADIAAQCSNDLPEGIRDRVNKLPIEDWLQNGKPNAGDAANDSDDDDVEALHRLMNADAGDSHFDAISPPLKRKGAKQDVPRTKAAARGRGGRGGRGRSLSVFPGGTRNAVDESMHENALARKLNRNEHEPETAAHSDQPAAKSVMGKKTETVREQQERQKAGLKDKIAEMKKAQNDKPSGAKPVVRPVASLEGGDVIMRDEHHDQPDEVLESAPSGSATAPAPKTSINYDYDLDIVFEPADVGAAGAAAADDESGRADDVPSSSSLPSSSKSPSPCKMIQHPKVVELAQERTADPDMTRKREKKHQEALVKLGMELSDSEEESGDDEEMETRKEAPPSTKRSPVKSPFKSPLVVETARPPVETAPVEHQTTSSMKGRLSKSPSKTPQKSPLAMETSKSPPVESTPVQKPTPSPMKPQLGLSARIIKSTPTATPAATAVAAGAVTRAGNVTVTRASWVPAVPPPSSGMDLLDDILAGAHQTEKHKQERSAPASKTTAKKPAEKAVEEKEKEKEKAADGVEVDAEGEGEEDWSSEDEVPLATLKKRRSSRRLSTRSRASSPSSLSSTSTTRRSGGPSKTPSKTPVESRGNRRISVNEKEVEAASEFAVARRTRSKSMCSRGGEDEALSPVVEARTRSEKVPPKTPAKAAAAAPTTRAMSAPKIPVKAPPKTPTAPAKKGVAAVEEQKRDERLSDTSEEEEEESAPVTRRISRARTPAPVAAVAAPSRRSRSLRSAATPAKPPISKVSPLSEASSEEEEEENAPTTRRTSRGHTPAPVAAPSQRSRRSAATPAKPAVNKKPSISTKVEAVKRQEKLGAKEIGKGREAAARLRESAAAAAAAAVPPSRPSGGRTKNVPAAAATTTAAAAAQDDTTPFSRNSRRTAMSAPRKPAAAAAAVPDAAKPIDDIEMPTDEVAAAASAAEDTVQVDAEPTEESSRAEEHATSPSPHKKRIARMGSTTDDHVTAPVEPVLPVVPVEPVVPAAPAATAVPIADPATPTVSAAVSELPEEELLDDLGVDDVIDDDEDEGGMRIDDEVEKEKEEEVIAPAAPPPPPAASAASATPPIPAVSAASATPPIPAASTAAATPPILAVSAAAATTPIPAVSAASVTPPIPAASAASVTPPIPAASAAAATPPIPASSATPPIPAASAASATPPPPTETVASSAATEENDQEEEQESPSVPLSVATGSVSTKTSGERLEMEEEAPEEKEEEEEGEEEEKAEEEEEKADEEEAIEEAEPADTVAVDDDDDDDAADAAAADEEEVVPGSCIVEDAEEMEEREEEERVERTETAASPAPWSDNEMGDLMIDDGPNSPLITPPPISPPIVDTVPPKDTVSGKDTVATKQQPPTGEANEEKEVTASGGGVQPKATDGKGSSDSATPSAAVDAAAPAAVVAAPAAVVAAPAAVVAAAVVTQPVAVPVIKRARPPKRPHSDAQEGPSVAAAKPLPRAAPAARPATVTVKPAATAAAALAVQKVQPAAPAAPAAAPLTAAEKKEALDQKRRAVMASMAAVPGIYSSTSSSTRGGAVTGRGGRGARGGGGVTAAARVTSTAGSSSSAAAQSVVDRMAKNLRRGKPAMSGTSRAAPAPARKTAAATAAPVASSTRAVAPPTQQQRPSTSAVAARTVAAPAKAKPITVKPANEPRPLKRKLTDMHAMEPVAIRAPDAKTRGQPSAAPTTSAASPESRLITTVLAVCKEEESVEKAMQQLELENLTMLTIVNCVCRALTELPQSNTWHVVRSNMMKKVESVDSADKVVPKAEKMLFRLLLSIQDRDQARLAGLFDCFYDEYCRSVYTSISAATTVADVTRSTRLLFFGLKLTERSEKNEEAQKVFNQILQKKSSQAVCQSLTYLLCQSQTASLASEILGTELDDDENGGRLISMHMSNKKDAEVLNWAVGLFASESCKTAENAAFRTPATLEMVEGWWESDMEFVERAREHSGAVAVGAMGQIKFDEFNKRLMLRMPLLISPQFKIEGLDRVKLLAQLDTPAIDAIDRVTATRIEETGLGSLFADTSSVSLASLEEGEARVVVLKLHISIAALTAFYADRMYGVDQREALRLHLLTLIERVHAILNRPACEDKATSSSQQSSGISLGLSAIREWRDTVQRLTKMDLMGTPATSSPAKKKPRSEEYCSNDPSSA